jgi:hypothetical protein
MLHDTYTGLVDGGGGGDVGCTVRGKLLARAYVRSQHYRSGGRPLIELPQQRCAGGRRARAGDRPTVRPSWRLRARARPARAGLRWATRRLMSDGTPGDAARKADGSRRRRPRGGPRPARQS